MPNTTLERWPTPSFASLIDRPAREALQRADAGLLQVLAPGLLGLGLVSLTTLLGLAFGQRLSWAEPLLRALVESLVLSTPVLMIVVVVALPRLSPTTTAATLSVSVGVAGLATVLLLPLLAFLQLSISRLPEQQQVLLAVVSQFPLVAAPAFFLVATAVVLRRTLSTFEVRAGELMGWLFGSLAIAVFVLRLPRITGI